LDEVLDGTVPRGDGPFPHECTRCGNGFEISIEGVQRLIIEKRLHEIMAEIDAVTNAAREAAGRPPHYPPAAWSVQRGRRRST
jgi:hypothetical protein